MKTHPTANSRSGFAPSENLNTRRDGYRKIVMPGSKRVKANAELGCATPKCAWRRFARRNARIRAYLCARPRVPLWGRFSTCGRFPTGLPRASANAAKAGCKPAAGWKPAPQSTGESTFTSRTPRKRVARERVARNASPCPVCKVFSRTTSLRAVRCYNKSVFPAFYFHLKS
jgi:hypothetical protein